MTDREKDALIAGKVFGWKDLEFSVKNKVGTPDHKFVHFMSSKDAKGHYIESKKPIEVGSGDEENASHYSTDPAASKQLREKLAEMGARRYVKDMGRYRRVGVSQFYCEIHMPPPRDSGRVLFQQYVAEADTEELAVVECALKMINASLTQVADTPEGRT